MGDKFTMSIKRGKLAISFCKLFCCIKNLTKETSAMKWFQNVLNKYVNRMSIFMLVPEQGMLSYSRYALFLPIHSRGIKIKTFLILS